MKENIDIVTCKVAQMYPGMLTRGNQYKVLDVDNKKNCLKIVCDNGKARLFDIEYFNLSGKSIAMLVDWKFDDDIKEVTRTDFLSWVEVTIKLSDDSTRWCKLYTPDLLSRILTQNAINPPGIYIPNIIIVRSFEKSDIDKMLKYLDDENELIACSLPL